MKIMNLNLGKTILIVMLLPMMAWAEVSATLSKKIIYRGDQVRLIIEAKGENIEFPELREIEGYPVLGTSNRSSVTIINGNSEKTVSKSYVFQPTKDVVIPLYKVVVDGVEEMTNPLHLRVAKPSASIAMKDGVALEMKVDKKEVYVGEPITLSLTFKSHPNTHYDKIELSEPTFKKFWVKKVQGLKQGVDGDFMTQTYQYILFPQEDGNITLDPPYVRLGTRVAGSSLFSDPFFGNVGFNINWKKIFANELTVYVKPLPNQLEVYGDFRISAEVDKNRVKANKPVNLTIDIMGQGNIEDIKKFELDIPNAVVYSDELKVSNSGLTKGVVTQKVAIVADRNLTIPSIAFTYFDAKTKKPKTIKTDPIDIEVMGASTRATQSSQIEEREPTKVTIKDESALKSSEEERVIINDVKLEDKLLWYALGMVSGLLLSLFGWFGFKKIKGRVKRVQPMVKQIKKAKTDKALFELLLPYRDEDEAIKATVDKLERNIYASGSEKIDREDILEFFEEEG
jgi:hypothetical protein